MTTGSSPIESGEKHIGHALAGADNPFHPLGLFKAMAGAGILETCGRMGPEFNGPKCEEIINQAIQNTDIYKNSFT